MSSMSSLRELGVRTALYLRYGTEPPDGGAFRSAVRRGEDGSGLVRGVLAAGEPCMVGKLGSAELGCVSFRTRWRGRWGVRLPYPRSLRRTMEVNAGVFPTDDESLDRFSDVFLEAVSQADVLGVWLNRNEHRIVNRFCPAVQLIELEALNCVLWQDPWSAGLAGKTVLVVHPFATTIESQYRTSRTLLFGDPKVLPEFELKTLAAVQSGAGNECGFATWFEALERMREDIANIEFDVAIIGAGAYGLPLAAAVKEMGRQAVHLGGATQLLFGIRGRRWETESPDDIAPLFNEHWVRPSAEERPPNSDAVEGGCYW
ncbi:MAG TPA: hypothetical protein VIK31_13590 [Propionibacteriaceae bacterium]